jgi:hypothetical protein
MAGCLRAGNAFQDWCDWTDRGRNKRAIQIYVQAMARNLRNGVSRSWPSLAEPPQRIEMKPGQAPAAAGWNKGTGSAYKWLVDHMAYQHDYCLIWPFSLTRGYGHLSYKGKRYAAHRLMCELVYGDPPVFGYQAAHSCGKGHKACVNPRHLSWKEAADNQLDKRVHGTAYRGGKKWKLTPIEVLEIRGLKGTKTQDELAEIYGVGRQNIGAILTGRSWTKI